MAANPIQGGAMCHTHIGVSYNVDVAPHNLRMKRDISISSWMFQIEIKFSKFI